MAVIRAFPYYARLRRRPNDQRLHITENGTTHAGQLVGAGLIFRSNDFPYLTIDLDNTDPFEIDAGPKRFELRAPDVFAADVNALAAHAHGNFAYQELQRCCEHIRDALNTAAPECRHEDVIETPEFARVEAPGICDWCTTPLVLVDDEWRSAT